ncbi:uncharacterized protein LOC135704090 [Ochlerotatus camptorhynchus]|uniref:uncharacterized protein LOC135704090 n=1 Tax=Ochlerotatus camptorhynchus TaxID=644619 RepID=UPI0031DB53DE
MARHNKAVKYRDQLYLVHLEKNSTTFMDLQDIRVLFNILVKWERYKPVSHGVTQCSNCLLFGLDEANPICANCGADHKATSKACPKRTEYFEIRKKASTRNQPGRKKVPEINDQNFPPIPRRPITVLPPLTRVYVALFKPLRVSRHQFKKVLNCMKLVRSLKYQEIYAQEKVTKVDSLSLVLSGKLVVSQNQKALHIVFPHQFLDSPEWFGVSTDDYFQVSIMAMEESRVLIWHRDKLKLSIMAEPFLQAVFDHILGRDVVKKLMQVTQVSETMAQSNGYISSGYGEDAEDKPMLVMKNSKSSDNGGHGLTALINRQLQALPRISKYYYCAAADPNAWRLGRIDEADHETAV